MQQENYKVGERGGSGIGNVPEVEGKYLTFWTQKQLYGIPIADVVQIVGIQDITGIPELPYYAKGIINLRGSIIPVIDIRLRFGMAEKEYDEKTCTIVTNIRENYVGIIVDAVEEVTDIGDNQVSPPPRMAGDYSVSYLTGIGKLEERVVLLINTANLLGADELAVLSEAAVEE